MSRVCNFLQNWKSITSDPEILNIVSGYKLEFENTPFQTYVPREIKFSVNEISIISEEISRLEKIGAIKKSFHERGEFISHIFTRLKPNGKIRIILNLKPLNKFLVYKHFKMEHLEFVFDLVRKCDWMGSLDLADAYFSVSVHPSHWKYLKFFWNGNLWCYKVLVFGIAQAPFVFTKLCKPILSVLRSTHYCRCSMYLDDLILIGQSQNEVKNYVQIALNLFRNLGFQINEEKSVLEPSQQLKHLGFVLDSTTLCVSIPFSKKEELKEKCDMLIPRKSKFKIRQVASVVGSLIAFSKGVKFGRLHYRTLEREKN